MLSDPIAGKPVPHPTTGTRAFWEGCGDRVLLYQRCDRCGHVQFPPRLFCTRCRAEGGRMQASSGLGTVHSYTVVFRPPTPAFKADVPYVIVLVDFDEGFRLMVNLRECPSEAARIGLRVRVVFEPLPGGGALPQARPLE